MVSSAARCFSGVTPAQQAESTLMGLSQKIAFKSSAFDTTQMSVHRPISSISHGSPAQAFITIAGSCAAPKVPFSTGV